MYLRKLIQNIIKSFVAIWMIKTQQFKIQCLFIFIYFFSAHTNWKYSGEWPTQTALDCLSLSVLNILLVSEKEL